MPYLYRPKGDHTPVNDPVLGHLSYDGVYEDPRCADDPRFTEAPVEKATKPEIPAETPADGEAKSEAEQAPPKRAKPAGS